MLARTESSSVQFSCKICEEVYETELSRLGNRDKCPVALPCGHCVCMRCGLRLSRSERVECPWRCHWPPYADYPFPLAYELMDTIDLARRTISELVVQQQTVINQLLDGVEARSSGSSPASPTRVVPLAACFHNRHISPFQDESDEDAERGNPVDVSSDSGGVGPCGAGSSSSSAAATATGTWTSLISSLRVQTLEVDKPLVLNSDVQGLQSLGSNSPCSSSPTTPRRGAFMLHTSEEGTTSPLHTGSSAGPLSEAAVEAALDAFGNVRAIPTLPHLVLLGARKRLPGTKVAQLARSRTDGMVYLLQFFTRRPAFETWQRLCMDTGSSGAASTNMEFRANEDGAAAAPDGTLLPPFCVQCCGQGLDDYVYTQRIFLYRQLLAILRAVAQALLALHRRQQVHGNLNMRTVLWCSATERWVLEDCRTSGSNSRWTVRCAQYAPPELVCGAAAEAGSSQAADMWAIGLISYELLSGCRVFAPDLKSSTIREVLSGKQPFPWEERHFSGHALLRGMGPVILACLSRDPELRPSARRLYNSITTELHSMS